MEGSTRGRLDGLGRPRGVHRRGPSLLTAYPVHHSAPKRGPARKPRAGLTLDAIVRDAEHHAIVDAMVAHGDNLSRTATALGIERNTLKRKLRAFGLYPAIRR